MNIEIQKSVTYNVNNVEIRVVNVNKNQERLMIAVPYTWKNDENEIIRTGINNYSEKILTSFNPALTGLIMAFKSLTDTNQTSNVSLIPTEDNKYKGKIRIFENNTWAVLANYNESEFETLLNSRGITFSTLTNIISAFTCSVV